MASISSLSGSSSSSSIYGNRNVISGLASGLDTEALIENSVAGYNQKIASLQGEVTKLEWKQESYQSMISKISSFLSSYTTFSSSTCLKATSFFSNATVVTTQGANAAKVSATGKTNSDIQILGVKQLATGASRTIDLAKAGITASEGGEVALADAYGASMEITVDGVTKTVTAPTSANSNQEYITLLQQEIDSAFGSGKLKVSDTGSDGNIALSFEPQEGSTFQVAANAATGDKKLSNYVDTSAKLSDLGFTNGYSVTINGEEFTFDKDTTLASMMEKINVSDAGATMTYSKITNQLTLTATETGEASSLTIEETGTPLFEVEGVNKTDGQDAIFTMSVNGNPYETSRSANTFDLDGMKVTLNGTFGEYSEVDTGVFELDAGSADPVTFGYTTDSSKVVDTVKQMVDELNVLLKEVKDAYSTMPLKNSSGDAYEPLTDDDKADMSESAITKYEEKVKTGLLFGDSDLSNFYYQVVNVLNSNVNGLNAIGIDMKYDEESGISLLSVDEDALKSAMETDPEKVANVFTGTGNGDGLIEQLQKPLETYGKTEGQYGILVEKAGHANAERSTYDNEIYNKIQDINEEIEKWQETISNKVDFYTKKFTYLEQLIAQMNNQSSMLMGLTGGY